MDALNINIEHALAYVSRAEVDALLPEVVTAKRHLLAGDAAGSDFLGWVDLPESIDPEMLNRLKADVARLADKSRLMVVVGIGGSYLGARMVIEALQSEFASMVRPSAPYIVYAGHTLSEDYYAQLLQLPAVGLPKVDVPAPHATSNALHREVCCAECLVHFVANLECLERDAGTDDGAECRRTSAEPGRHLGNDLFHNASCSAAPTGMNGSHGFRLGIVEQNGDAIRRADTYT